MPLSIDQYKILFVSGTGPQTGLFAIRRQRKRDSIYKGASAIRENTHEECSDDEECNHKKGYFNQDFYNLLICTLGLFVCGTLTGLM